MVIELLSVNFEDGQFEFDRVEVVDQILIVFFTCFKEPEGADLGAARD